MKQLPYLYVAVTLIVLTACSTNPGPSTVSVAPTETAMPNPEPTLAPTEVEATEQVVEATEEPMSDDTRTGIADADVIFVTATQTGPETWSFSVTVEHPDTGWEDYADGWDVVLPDGSVSKPDANSPFTRLLLHPHENEQPFTRSQSGVDIPQGVTEVTVRAHDIVAGFGGQEVVVNLGEAEGEGFTVTRQ